ncbi:molecular chaperone HtpG [Psychrobium sp. 1_MG-2023]|uniref:molecular chaperone HtpG n=1 Tax=Psychrobium sp. 1_MG-2023 TaxID=3062624 RepID=UPI000C32F4E4|nr:molecular chaperone HtpG [Psychrobium sp. 1_MG-2023]MDP2560329.1 molecular chaperone HtpG [Psychrobium sp. 1_MG-2023]PKF55440.1 molecular chaperone HtpG [Alteromonadales bacterium alter-6D02]
MSETTQTHGFQTEVTQLLQLMIHSLYSNKEIFLRELVSNAADAADKLRFKALEDSALYEDDGELRVRVSFDKEARTITINDNGIGMNRDDVIEHLGTIAKSGTAEFFSNLTGDQAKDSQLIGQFGVGFYSSFIVADRVTVNTRKAGTSADQGVRWESEGKGSYDLTDITKAERGTEIILHLNEGEEEFLNDYRLKQVISKYSDHISISVEMFNEEVAEQDGPDGEKIPAIPASWAPVNKATAIWTLSKSELEDSDYNEFYKHVAHDFEDPLTWAHNKVEGKLEYTSLLYIPARAPWDMYNRESSTGLKLYVQRVFIMDDAEQFMPTYLRFVKGLVDSNDLPLNVSREILQENKVTQQMRNGCTKRVLQMLDRLGNKDAEKYQKFWKEFGQVLKEGPAEDAANKEAIAKLLRFASTHADTSEQTVSLKEYIERMPEGQESIYFITADSFQAAKNSPHLEQLRSRGYEVLLMSDRIDEWLMSHLTEFDGKQLQSVVKADLDLGEVDEATKEKQAETDKAFETVAERIKTVLGDEVKDVRVSHRLTNTPSCIVSDGNDMTSQMIKLMEAAGQPVPETKFIFEFNPEHTLVKHLADEQDEARFEKWVDVLYRQAQLSERGSLEDPAGFINKMNELMLDLAKA